MSNSHGKQGSHQVNPGDDGDDGAVTLTATELAEIKEVVGRLYKKITELEISQKSQHEQDRAELKAWAQTNLIQTQLSAKQTAVIEILTTELKDSERLSQQSETHSESLLVELQSLKGLLENMPKSSPNVENLELKGLKTEVAGLREALKGVPQKLEKVIQGQTALETRQTEMEVKLLKIDQQTVPRQSKTGITAWNSRNWWWIGGGLVLMVGLGLKWTKVENQVGWSYTKTQRIEKKLGIKSN